MEIVLLLLYIQRAPATHFSGPMVLVNWRLEDNFNTFGWDNIYENDILNYSNSTYVASEVSKS